MIRISGIQGGSTNKQRKFIVKAINLRSIAYIKSK